MFEAASQFCRVGSGQSCWLKGYEDTSSVLAVWLHASQTSHLVLINPF